ncbi:MAG: response regulator [Candidatus Cloacimonetes bacterium]|nr:response regulator [Candidatus Cloacimonadota bacterium]
MEKPKILIVDDRIENIVAIEKTLENINAELIRAHSGNEALKLTLDHDIALVLLDVQMPGMDGFETVELMKQVQKTKYIPVIFISAIYLEEIYKTKGVEVGGVDYICKPIIPSVLIGKVKVFLDIYNQRKDLEREIEMRKIAEKKVITHKERLLLINSILRHDITNNLAVIKSAFRMFSKTHDVKIIEDASDYINKSVNLIRRMSIFGEYMDTPGKLKVFGLKKILQPIIEENISIEINMKGNGNILADETIDSVFDNLIKNAIIHGKTERIDINITNRGKICEVRISDYGIGIPEDVIEKIFDENYIYGRTGHTGIGLHIVKTAMENFGGNVYIENNEPKGTTFVLEFINS